jgi:hypothetical protein
MLLWVGASKADLYFENKTETTSLKGKSPDISLMVIVAGEGSLSQYLTITVEVGYSETYKMFKEGCRGVVTWKPWLREMHQQIHTFLLGFQALFSGFWLFNKCTRPGK